MNAIIYYSNTNESLNIAKYISDKENLPLYDINTLKEYTFDFIYLIFPIHYQSIPKEIIPSIKKIKANRAIVIATYGKMSFGHVLYDIKKILKAKIIAGAYIPAKHTYLLKDKPFNDYNKLDSIIQLKSRTEEIKFPKTKKNIFSNFLPRFRHQISVKIIKNKNCNQCNRCNLICKNIKIGKPNNQCIRCLKCINSCPNRALEFKLSPIMNNYLKKERVNQFIVY